MIRDIIKYFQRKKAENKWARDTFEKCNGLLAELEGTSSVSEYYRAETLANMMCILMTWDRTKKGMPQEFYDCAIEAIRTTAERSKGHLSLTIFRLEERANKYYGRKAA